MGTKWSSQDEDSDAAIDTQTDKLSAKQLQAVRDTWRSVSVDLKNFGVTFFLRFFRKHPKYVNVFQAFQGETIDGLKDNLLLRAHAVVVLNTLISAMDFVNDTPALKRRLKRTVRSHVPKGVGIEQFEDMISVFLDHVADHMGESFDEKTSMAWQAATQVILNVIRDILNDIDSAPT